jgi:hypothetical protein
MIDLTSSVFQTSRGIKIGDSLSKVIEKYGKTEIYNLSDSPNYYEYSYSSDFITFFIDKNEKVIGLR